MKKDFLVLVRMPDGQHQKRSDRWLRHRKGAQKGGRNNIRRYKWTAETARKAALKSWRKKSKVTGRRKGQRFTPAPITPDYSQWQVVQRLQRKGQHDTPKGVTVIRWKAATTVDARRTTRPDTPTD